MNRTTYNLGALGDLEDTNFNVYGDYVVLTFRQGAIRRTVNLPLRVLAAAVTATRHHANFIEKRAERFRKFADGEDSR